MAYIGRYTPYFYPMVYVAVISCFSSFIVGIGFGMYFLVSRAAQKAFEDSIS